jgi:hypothetical protein
MNALYVAALTWSTFTYSVGSLDYSHFPPLFLCEVATKQAEREYRILCEQEEMAIWPCAWRLDEIRDLKLEAYRTWDVWWYAAALRRCGRSQFVEQYEDRLIGLVGRDAFESGWFPLPIEWR